MMRLSLVSNSVIAILSTCILSVPGADKKCYQGEPACTEKVPDVVLNSEGAQTTQNGNGNIRITKLGYMDVNTSIPWNHGSANESASLITTRQSTCVKDVSTLGDEVVSPGIGLYAESGKCGHTTRRIVYQFKLTYNDAKTGVQTTYFEAKASDDEGGSDPCGKQRLSNLACGGNL